jgi:hypothetical protein
MDAPARIRLTGTVGFCADEDARVTLDAHLDGAPQHPLWERRAQVALLCCYIDHLAAARRRQRDALCTLLAFEDEDERSREVAALVSGHLGARFGGTTRLVADGETTRTISFALALDEADLYQLAEPMRPAFTLAAHGYGGLARRRRAEHEVVSVLALFAYLARDWGADSATTQRALLAGARFFSFFAFSRLGGPARSGKGAAAIAYQEAYGWDSRMPEDANDDGPARRPAAPSSFERDVVPAGLADRDVERLREVRRRFDEAWSDFDRDALPAAVREGMEVHLRLYSDDEERVGAILGGYLWRACERAQRPGLPPRAAEAHAASDRYGGLLPAVRLFEHDARESVEAPGAGDDDTSLLGAGRDRVVLATLGVGSSDYEQEAYTHAFCFGVALHDAASVCGEL